MFSNLITSVLGRQEAAVTEARASVGRRGKRRRNPKWWQKQREPQQVAASSPVVAQSEQLTTNSPPKGQSMDLARIEGQSWAHFGDNYHYHGDEPPHAKQRKLAQEAHQHRQDVIARLMESLKFSRMGARERNVAIASPLTCEWILSDERFKSWLDHSSSTEHKFLWIKGKPGSGKSTIMKSTKAWAEKEMSDQITLSYFFNARSDIELEKSILGLWQTVVHQLLEAHDGSRYTFLQAFAAKEHRGSVDPWEVSELQNYFIPHVCSARLPPINIFIDALDENHDEEAQKLVILLEDFTCRASALGARVRVCISSRHYPNVQVRKGVALVVEEQPGHEKDIQTYLSRALCGDDNDDMRRLRTKISKKAEGVFLWVVLIVPMLNKAFNQGSGVKAMIEKLKTVPTGLHDLFADLLARDLETLDQSLVLFRWVYYAGESLSITELYTAMAFTDSSTQTTADSLPEADVMERYILHCSRGLVEFSTATPQTVQFIHQSVRDHLKSKYEVESSYGFSLEAARSHAIMAKTCLEYLLQLPILDVSDGASQKYSLGKYAAEYWWHHMPKTSRPYDQTLLDLVSRLLNNKKCFTAWTQYQVTSSSIFGIAVEKPKSENLLELHGEMFYHTIMERHWDLADILLKAGMQPSVPLPADCWITPLTAAILAYDANAVDMLVRNNVTEKVDSGNLGRALWLAKLLELPHVAKMLVQAGAIAVQEGGAPRSNLEIAVWLNHAGMVKSLLSSQNAAVQYECDTALRPHWIAAFEMLMEQFSDVPADSLRVLSTIACGQFGRFFHDLTTFAKLNLAKFGIDLKDFERLFQHSRVWDFLNELK